ncbi:MAG: sugar transferase [Gammaproteobacteria bacterium]|nr:sugar transferase [Gammaproteobacteria bacterium]
MKYFIEFIVALIVIILLLPVMAVIAALIKIKIGSPIIFKQLRPGFCEKPFFLYKFRTMTSLCDLNRNLLSDEKRLTSVGKFLRKYSLDELPQLFNILKGDISFVGPRPLLMDYLKLYTGEQSRRHEVKPGITGWAQVNGRNAISWEEKFKLDVWYVNNRSFLLDLKILWMTLIRVLRRDGINQFGQATMEKFKGNAE